MIKQMSKCVQQIHCGTFSSPVGAKQDLLAVHQHVLGTERAGQLSKRQRQPRAFQRAHTEVLPGQKKKKTSALLRTPDLLWSTAARLSKLRQEAKSNAGVTPRQGKVNNSQLGKASQPHCVCSEGTQSGHSGRSLTSAPGNMSDDGGGGLFTVWSCDTTAASGLVAMATTRLENGSL